MHNLKFRNNGAVGALLDEYQKALNELYALIENVSKKQLTTIVDPNTKDEDCRSIQTILTHIIKSGYYYALEIRRLQGESIQIPEKEIYMSTIDYEKGIRKMFKLTETVFLDFPNLDLNKPIKIRWESIGSIDLLLEHAIVHILRHRRQISRFLLKL